MIPVKVLALRYIPNGSPSLSRSLGAPEGYPSLGILTTDSDDATYIALDEATKAADVKVCYAHSFYAGAPNATTPNAGEVIGILAGPTPGAVRSGMEAALSMLERVGFQQKGDVPYLAQSDRLVERVLSTPTTQRNMKLFEKYITAADRVQKSQGKKLNLEKKVALATTLANTKTICEGTNSANIPSKTYFMDMLTAVVPNLIAPDIVST